MKHFLGLILALVLVLAAGSAVMAMPNATGTQGQFTVFGDFDYFWDDFELGAGYALTDNFALGGFYAMDGYWGAFAQLGFDPFIVKGEIGFDVDLAGNWYARVMGNYNLTFDWFALGLGGGAEIYNDTYSSGQILPFVEVAGEIALGENVSIYGSFYHYFFPAYEFEAGLALKF